MVPALLSNKKFFIILSIVLFIATISVLVLLLNIQQRKAEAAAYPLKVVTIGENEIDPLVWGKNFPYHYDLFIKTKEDYGQTPYGGSVPYSKLEKYPAMKRLWAGNAFSIDHNEERGHYYSAIDQANTKRVSVVSQPGACVNCHAAEAPRLIAQLGWEAFNKTPYNDLKSELNMGSSCADCHDPQTMELTITRPALKHALADAGIDLASATRQEMRSYVCAQCHVEYYFKGDNNILTYPWSKGRTIEAIEEHYDDYNFKDWVHKETGAPMIKIQHPEFELWGTGIHAKSGVSCADCHMPYLRVGSIKISDHWLRSPLHNLNQACQPCHHITEEKLRERVLTIQDRTAKLLRQSEAAMLSAIDALVNAQQSGVAADKLAPALKLHRAAQIRWDFVSSENSTGFHSAQESARILAESIDLARQMEIQVLKVSR